LATTTTRSPPAISIAERIIDFQSDDSFLQLQTPTSPRAPTPPPKDNSPRPMSDVISDVTSLSPPPRRGSKQLSVPESEPEPVRLPPKLGVGEGDTPRMVSLSEPGSVISLAIGNGNM